MQYSYCLHEALIAFLEEINAHKECESVAKGTHFIVKTDSLTAVIGIYFMVCLSK